MTMAEGAPKRTEIIRFSISSHEMAEFARLSGDDNPLHHNRDVAVACGFAGPIVYGGLLIAQVSRLLGTHLPGHGCIWRTLTLKFRNALFVDEEAELTGTVRHANPELGNFLIELRIEANGRLIADGEAQASLPRTTRGASWPARA